MIDFADIKSRHRIEDVLIKRGVELRRASGGFACKCPIHGEQKGTSFTVNVSKQLWSCFGKCAPAGGSVIDLIMALDNVPTALAAAEILEGRALTTEEKARPRVQPPVKREVVHPRELPSVPKLYRGKEPHLKAVAELRKLPWTGIADAQEQGCLRFCVAYDQPAYAILDVENPCNVQVRRLDGKLWFERAKVMGIKGNWAAWPVGLSAACRFLEATILLVEGTGDFLAGWDIRNQGINALPVAMFGASTPIHDGALAAFTGREVIVCEQHDPAGESAAERWLNQLHEVGARARRWRIPGEGEDLNDFISAGGDAWEIFNC